MKAQFVNENRLRWSGKDPTKSPVIGKIMTRRTEFDGRTMKPEILEVVEKYEDYYILNKWYKSGVPQLIHDKMVSHYIPIEKYKDLDLEGRTIKEHFSKIKDINVI